MAEIPVGEFLLPVFPLPDVVFFPNTRLPLHIFERRYREMVSDALDGNRLIGMVLLRPGWEKDYYGAPPIHSFGTVGEIERVEHLEDGRFNLVLNGLVRYRVEELVSDSPYRVARVRAVPEVPELDETKVIRGTLVRLSRRLLASMPTDTAIPELATASLDSIVNALVMALQLTPDMRQDLLEVSSVAERAREVETHLERTIEMLDFLAPFRSSGGDPGRN